MEKAVPKRNAARSGISQSLIDIVTTRIREDRRIRRTLPNGGRMHIDRQVPFLCVYRRTPELAHLDMQFLVTSEAAYVYADAGKDSDSDLRRLIRSVAEFLAQQFGSYLILEIWPGEHDEATVDEAHARGLAAPRFRLIKPQGYLQNAFIDKFIESLSRIKIEGHRADVELVSRSRVSPPGLRPLLTAAESRERQCLLLGLEISPVFCDPDTGRVFPQVRRDLERQLSIALKRCFFQFARTQTTHRPPHFHSLGRRATVKAVWRADRMLDEVSDKFDFLLQVSPVNSAEAWREFRRAKFRVPPRFHYRPLPIDPVLLKRDLYKVPLERVEDPAIGQLLRDKLLELDRQISMLLDIDTPQFVHGSIQLYGDVESNLLETAVSILDRIPPESKSLGPVVDANGFAARAEEEIALLRCQDPSVQAKATVRSDVNGLMVSQGSLLIGAETNIPERRVNALLQHEIGTHVLTYYNGHAQPFRQLHAGLSGYEALQEGIAVLSEYLVGGLDSPRMRLLAARVVGVGMMIDGATFLECFQRMVDQYGIAERSAFTLAMRVYRGGGLTKDAIYLRGLLQTLNYLRKGGEIEPLFIGKISAEHIGIMKELRWRKVLGEPRLTPRYMTDPNALSRLELVRGGIDVLDLIT